MDEIGNMSLTMQVSCTRPAGGQVRPIGSTEEIDVDVPRHRATNKESKKKCPKAGSVRICITGECDSDHCPRCGRGAKTFLCSRGTF